VITEHIQRFMSMTDEEFINHAQYYRRFRGVSTYEHTYNIDYITKRAHTLGYNFTAGCCNKYYLTKNDNQI
jgi:hypothetical protein